MGLNLFEAHTQWATRPADERYTNLEDLARVTRGRMEASVDTSRVRMRDARFAAVVPDAIPSSDPGRAKGADHARMGTRLALVTGDDRAPGGLLTNWSLSQLTSRLNVPRPFLSTLSPGVVEDVLNDRARLAPMEDSRLLTGKNGHAVVRACHGSAYERLWDAEVVEAVQKYLPAGWHNPVAYDGGKFGAPKVPSGLYASDRDVWMFLVSGGEFDWQDGGVDVDGDVLHRGFFVWNSEVGDKSFGWTSFWHRGVCGNHIVWGAEDVEQVRARHVGDIRVTFKHGFTRFLSGLDKANSRDAFAELVREAKREIAVALERGVPMRSTGFAPVDEKALETAVPRFRKEGFTEPQVRGALRAIRTEEPKATGTRWDWLQGFTAYARDAAHTAERVAIERKAAKVLL